MIRRCLGAALVLACCGLFAAGAASAQTLAPDGCYPIPPQQPADYSNPPNLDLIKRQLLYYRCSRYDADVAAVLDEAKKWVALRAPQVARPAIVLDIDETSLSNWTRIHKDDYGYIPKGECRLDQAGEACGELSWEASENALAIVPTLELYKRARCIEVTAPCQPVDVFFVTGRWLSNDVIDFKTSLQWTWENLDRVGYKGITRDHLYLRPADSTGLVEFYKTAARADIEARFGVTIIANVGDQDSDLVGGHAERVFKVPNPFYFIP